MGVLTQCFACVFKDWHHGLIKNASEYLVNCTEDAHIPHYASWQYKNGDFLEGQSKYTERKKKRRVNFIPKFYSSLKKLVKYFTMITKRYMYGTKVPNFIGL